MPDWQGYSNNCEEDSKMATLRITNYFLMVALGLGFVSATAIAQLSDTASPSTVLAEVNGVKLTAAEFDQAEGSKLLQSRF